MSVERRDRVGRLAAISAVWRAAFDRTREAATLAVATGAARAALAEADADDPRRGVLMEGLASALQEKYLLTGDMAVLRDSIRLGRDALAYGNVDAALVSGNLCGRLMLLFEATQEPGLMDEAVARCRDAVAAAEPGSPTARVCLANLSQALFRRYEVFADAEALAESLEVGRRVLEETAEDDPVLHKLRHNHAAALRARYEREGDVAFLNESCALLKQAIAGDPGNPMYLMSEAGVLLLRYYASGDVADARAALRSCLAALELTGDRSPRLAAYLNITAAVLGELGKAEADVELTRRAVEYGRACVEATPPGASDRPFHLGNLAGHLSILHSRTGEEEPLREAVVLLHQAFDLLPEGHLGRAGHLAQMAECLMRLYDHTGEEDLADEAIAAIRGAIALTPAQSPLLGSMFNNLSVALRMKHFRSPVRPRGHGCGGGVPRQEGLPAVPRRRGRLHTRLRSAAAGRERTRRGRSEGGDRGPGGGSRGRGVASSGPAGDGPDTGLRPLPGGRSRGCARGHGEGRLASARRRPLAAGAGRPDAHARPPRRAGVRGGRHGARRGAAGTRGGAAGAGAGAAARRGPADADGPGGAGPRAGRGVRRAAGGAGAGRAAGPPLPPRRRGEAATARPGLRRPGVEDPGAAGPFGLPGRARDRRSAGGGRRRAGRPGHLHLLAERRAGAGARRSSRRAAAGPRSRDGDGVGALARREPGAGQRPPAGAARLAVGHGGRTRAGGARSGAAAILKAMPDCPLVHLACHAVVDTGSPWVGGIVLDDPARPLLTVGEISRLELSGAGLAYLSACETGGVRFGEADEAVRKRFPDTPVLWAAFCHHGR